VHSNFYTFVYAAAISVVTAIILAFTAEQLKPAQEANVALDKKSNILKSVRLFMTERAEIERIYDARIKEMVVNASGEVIENVDADKVRMKDEVAKPAAERQLPVYQYTDESGKRFFVLPMHGVGLWGPIWGYIALESDGNTVYGAYFDHKGETPGLGAEISEKPFQDQFQGKKIVDAQNNFVSVHVMKQTAKAEFGDEHRVDGISGGTITSNGADAMLKNCVEPYLSYLEKQKANQ
jgi:Na+-transporting NADH:ubiquinone oxidoreductase subunit C